MTTLPSLSGSTPVLAAADSMSILTPRSQGAAYVKTIIDALMNSPAWHDSIFILAYDEGGGLYDHVPPFTVVPPDATPPQLGPNDLPGDFTLSGFRVPIIVVSPFVKPHFVSHTNRELTQSSSWLNTRFNLAPLTARDAAADDMTKFFDFVIRRRSSRRQLCPPSRHRPGRHRQASSSAVMIAALARHRDQRPLLACDFSAFYRESPSCNAAGVLRCAPIPGFPFLVGKMILKSHPRSTPEI